METKFGNFTNENKVERSYETFIKDVRKALVADFKNTNTQADAFIEQYDELLMDLWKNGFSVREAIAATKRPGFRVDNSNVDESIIYKMDDEFENIYTSINDMVSMNESLKIVENIENYFKTYSVKTYSDLRIVERVKNNYSRLRKMYNEKLDNLE